MDLFTYGTLQFDEVWNRVTGRRFPMASGEVTGFVVYRVDGYDFPGMTPQEGATTPGTVYTSIDQGTLAELDRFEGEFYERWKVNVTGADGEIRLCEAYVVPPHNTALLTDDVWTRKNFLASGGLTRFLNRYAGFSETREHE